MKRGEAFGGKDTIVGYECDGCEIEWRDGLPFPTHPRDGTPDGFEILGTAPAQWHPDDCQWSTLGKRQERERRPGRLYPGRDRGDLREHRLVHGLRGGDPAVERITRNILERLGR